MKLETNLETIKNSNPNNDFWNKLLEVLGQDKNNPDLETEVSLRFIFKNNGLDDALWALRCFPDLNTAIKWYALWCVENVSPLMNDDISTYVNKVLDANRQYLLGNATKDDLSEAIFAENEACGGAADKLIGEDGLIAAYGLYAARESVYAARASDAARAAERAADASAWSALASVSTFAAERQAQAKEFKRMLDCIESCKEYKI